MSTKRLLVLAFVAVLSLFFSGCGDRKQDQLSHIKIHKYKQKSSVVNDDPSDDWIFWYIIMNDNGSCYYYSSPTPVTNYSAIAWTSSPTIPYAISDKNPNAEEVEELGEEEVSVEELGEEMQSDMEAEAEADAESGESDGDSGGDSDGGDSGGGDGGGDGGGGE